MFFIKRTITTNNDSRLPTGPRMNTEKGERMKEQKTDQMQLFKNLLQKMYEKGENEERISTKELLQDMEGDLRSIFSQNN